MDTELSGLPAIVPEIPGCDLLDKIGEGGMGEVFRATQLSLQRTIAVKFLHPLPSEQKALSFFHRETRLMAALTHPHVVTIYDCGQSQGRHYLMMEYLAGSTLRSKMQPGQPWSTEQAAPVLDAISQALSYIHEQGVLHLDLKPENVLCTERGDIKITDFGLATPRVDARTLSEYGLSHGTVDYCPPEQRYGLPLDQRSDVFALTTLTYELLTGTLPGRAFVPATQHNSRLPIALNEVLRKGLARDLDERYGSVEEWRLGMAKVLGWNKPPSSRRTTFVAVAAALLVGLGVSLFWPAGEKSRQAVPADGPPPSPASVADLLAGRLSGGEKLLYTSNRTNSSNIFLINPDGSDPINLTKDPDQNGDPAWSPDGKHIAFTSNRSGRADIFVMDADGGNVKQVTQGQGANRLPVWSPQGGRIVFASDRNGGSNIYVMDADGSQQTNLTPYPGFYADPAWSPDGLKIVFASQLEGKQGFRLAVMDADGTNVRLITKRDNIFGLVYPAWSPDGETIVFGEDTFDAIELFTCDSEGAHKKQLTKLGGSSTRAAWSPDGKLIAFQHMGDGNDQASLFIVDADGGNPTEILRADGPVEGGRVAWKPKQK